MSGAALTDEAIARADVLAALVDRFAEMDTPS